MQRLRDFLSGKASAWCDSLPLGNSALASFAAEAVLSQLLGGRRIGVPLYN